MADEPKASQFEELCLAYMNTFTSESGQKVLADLKEQIDGPSYRTDDDPARQPYVMSWREGRRSVWDLIERMMATYVILANTPREEREIKVEMGSPFEPLDSGDN